MPGGAGNTPAMTNTPRTRIIAVAPLLLTCVAFTASTACDLEEPGEDEFADLGQPEEAAEAAPEDGWLEPSEAPSESEEGVRDLPPLLARVERGTASVEWRAPEDSGEDVFLFISGTDADQPIIDMDTAEGLSAVEAWVAIADEPTLVPPLLLERASVSDRELLADSVRVEALREEVEDKMLLAFEAGAGEPQTHAVGTCTTSQTNTARNVYGNGYTPTSTCGQHLGFRTTNKSYLYCGDGESDGCDYPLGRSENMCIPALTDNALVYGSLEAFGMRSRTAGNPSMQAGGHRIRSLTYNCHNNGNVNIHMEYGADDWDYTGLESGYYLGVVILGSGHLPKRVTAIDLVAYNLWDNGIGASGSTYKTTRYSITGNAGNGDFGIFCTDTQKSISMSAGPTANPHSWCIGSCSVGNCWD